MEHSLFRHYGKAKRGIKFQSPSLPVKSDNTMQANLSSRTVFRHIPRS